MNIIKPKLIYPPNGYTFDTHTDIQNEFINNVLNNGTDFAVKQLEAVKCDNECSYPQSLTFKWAECDCKEYVFEISKNIDYELTSLSTYAYGLAEGATEKGIRKRTSEYYKEFLSMLDKFAPDKPLADKVYNFLLYAGVKSEIINIIKSIITI